MTLTIVVSVAALTFFTAFSCSGFLVLYRTGAVGSIDRSSWARTVKKPRRNRQKHISISSPPPFCLAEQDSDSITIFPGSWQAKPGSGRSYSQNVVEGVFSEVRE